MHVFRVYEIARLTHSIYVDGDPVGDEDYLGSCRTFSIARWRYKRYLRQIATVSSSELVGDQNHAPTKFFRESFHVCRSAG